MMRSDNSLPCHAIVVMHQKVITKMNLDIYVDHTNMLEISLFVFVFVFAYMKVSMLSLVTPGQKIS